MQLAITPHTAFRLAHAHAGSSVAQLVSATQALAASLGIPMEELCVLCSKETRLLSTPIEQLSRSLNVLRNTCMGGLTLQDTARVVIYSPALVCVPGEQLEAQFGALVSQLGVEPPLLAALARQQPYVLTTPVTRVRAQFDALSSLLGVDLARAVQLATAQPYLVVNPRLLQSKIGALAQLLGAEPTEVIRCAVEFPLILAADTHATSAWLSASSRFLDLPAAQLGQLVVRVPAIITLQPALLQQRFSVLCELMPARPRGEVMALVAAQPSLLGLEALAQPGPPGQQQQHQRS